MCKNVSDFVYLVCMHFFTLMYVLPFPLRAQSCVCMTIQLNYGVVISGAVYYAVEGGSYFWFCG